MMEGIERPNQEKSERTEKRKLTNIWEYWKLTPSKKVEIKEKNLKRIHQENEKTTVNPTIQQKSHQNG